MDVWKNGQTKLNSTDPPAELGVQNEQNDWVNYHADIIISRCVLRRINALTQHS